jgi:acetolactate synthase-1/3 small subunit
MTDKRYILSILVDNQPGVLSRIAGLFSGRGYNIESLCVAGTNEQNVSRVTMVTIGNENIVEQIKKQLHKLINIIKVLDLTCTKYIERELALIKVQAKPEYRAEILRIVDIFRCKVIDVGHGHYTLEVTGDEEKLTAILNLLKPFGIKEVARTGSIALNRDTK